MNIGTRIYYTGDMANPSGHFLVTAIDPAGHVTLTEIAGEGRTFPGVYLRNIGTEYHGHCDPRFVTEQARQSFYAARSYG